MDDANNISVLKEMPQRCLYNKYGWRVYSVYLKALLVFQVRLHASLSVSFQRLLLHACVECITHELTMLSAFSLDSCFYTKI